MSYDSRLPKLIYDIIESVEKLIRKQKLDRNITKPVKIRRSNSNTIVSWNIYFDTVTKLEDNFHILEKLVTKNLLNIQGEIIFYNVSYGTISDQTTSVYQDFTINKAMLWDIYLYKPEIFIYIRLLHESMKKQPYKDWISLDIDVIEKSAWFSE